MNDIDKTTQKVLRACQISLCEHFLMCTVGYGILLPPEKLVQTSASLSEGDPRGEYTSAQYMEALQACIQEKWLQVITEKLYEQEMNSRKTADVPEIHNSSFAPGVIDFTEVGYLLHRQVLIDIFGTEHIQYSDSGWEFDETCNEIHVYAPTRELCIKRVDELKQSPSDYIGHDVRHIAAYAPEPIGCWKPNRFIVLPHGFHAVAQYQLNDERSS